MRILTTWLRLSKLAALTTADSVGLLIERGDKDARRLFQADD